LSAAPSLAVRLPQALFRFGDAFSLDEHVQILRRSLGHVAAGGHRTDDGPRDRLQHPAEVRPFQPGPLLHQRLEVAARAGALAASAHVDE
jgi:hypothetical protein